MANDFLVDLYIIFYGLIQSLPIIVVSAVVIYFVIKMAVKKALEEYFRKK